MDPNSRPRRIGVGGAVVAAGSVWEARMQSDDEASVNNAIVKATHLQAVDKNCNKQMSLKEGVNGKRPAWKTDVKLARPRSIGGTTPPATPRRSIGTTPPMTPRRSISSENDKSLTLSVSVKKARSDLVEGGEKTPGRVTKTRLEMSTAIVKSGELETVALRKVNSLPAQSSEKTNEKTEDVDLKTEETVDEKKQITEDVCQEIVVFADSKEDDQIDNGDHEEEEGEEEEKKSVDVKEMNVPKEISKNRVVDVEIKKYSQSHNRVSPSPSAVRKTPPPVIKRAASVYTVPPSTDKEENFTHSQSKLQSLVDLVMWRDASRSALVFGLGTFLIVSSSYANDLNFSFISVVAYVGLIYLGVMFVFKAVIRRGVVEEEERHRGVGVREEDVKRMLRLIMPYLNESLLQLRALFSGDPSTTLKMGVVLFVLARCGSSITLWNLAKFGNLSSTPLRLLDLESCIVTCDVSVCLCVRTGFLGAFTVPKIFISYSTHFSAYGKFWMRRFRDAWESCSHKKAVALALFTLVWNLSSVVARVWAAFMLFVAFRYYQQRMIWTTDQEDDLDDEEHVDDDHVEEEELAPKPIHKPKRATYTMMPNKLKKIS
ncbi:reticulon-like protein B21 isoform X2 [Brassica napus]|uniref:reticulon-like protein B21 isoform X2 n=1 Tax=Brassica napus TaxID=3708 RepID=UPI002078A3D3|nr:reticulon-like protein B21 isoform X2 [Brassica napus]